MSPVSANLLAVLRRHCNDGRGDCQECRPEDGVYCLDVRPIAESFAELRYTEVIGARERRWGRRVPSA